MQTPRLLETLLPFPHPRHALGAILDPQSAGAGVKDHVTRVHQSEGWVLGTILEVNPRSLGGEAGEKSGQRGVGVGQSWWDWVFL